GSPLIPSVQTGDIPISTRRRTSSRDSSSGGDEQRSCRLRCGQSGRSTHMKRGRLLAGTAVAVVCVAVAAVGALGAAQSTRADKLGSGYEVAGTGTAKVPILWR